MLSFHAQRLKLTYFSPQGLHSYLSVLGEPYYYYLLQWKILFAAATRGNSDDPAALVTLETVSTIDYILKTGSERTSPGYNPGLHTVQNSIT